MPAKRVCSVQGHRGFKSISFRQINYLARLPAGLSYCLNLAEDRIKKSTPFIHPRGLPDRPLKMLGVPKWKPVAIRTPGRSTTKRPAMPFWTIPFLIVASIINDSGKATLGQIQQFLRHRRQATTEIYLHEFTRDQTEVASILVEAGDRISDRKGNLAVVIGEDRLEK